MSEELILVDRAALHRVVKERDELKKKVAEMELEIKRLKTCGSLESATDGDQSPIGWGD